MRKWKLLALVAALSLGVSVPAVAQSVSVAQCTTITQSGQAVTEYSGVVDGVEVSGSVVQPDGVVSVNCQQLILEAAADEAHRTSQAETQPPAATAEAKTDGAKAEAGKAEAKASKAEPKAEAKAELPKTGGGETLFALVVGTLLVGGGLLLRRIAR